MDNAELTRQVLELRESEAATREQLHTIFNRLDRQDAMLETLHTMNTNVAGMAQGMERLGKDVKAVRADVDELKARPGKRWDSVVTVLITAVVTAVATLVLAKLGIV